MAKPKLLFEDNQWTFERLKTTEKAIAQIAFEELKLDVYPNQIEIIGSDQMLDAYSSIGLPVMYNHWSFGKHFIQQEYSYRKGLSGLAYEIVINSNPCISYCMEENTMTMQALVIAHAAYGHNHFFKNNYMFKQWTDADGIIDYLVFAKNYISKCEEEHGPEKVENLLDACHAIMDYGVDKYKRPAKLSKEKANQRKLDRIKYAQQTADRIWSTLPASVNSKPEIHKDKFPVEPQENILYFIEKYSPILEEWEREIVRIVRKISQYFYPQRQTKVMNEGWATFTHYYIMNRLWEKKLISDGQHLEFLHSHTGVTRQLSAESKHYHGFNPYALGFAMFEDIKRICENPTDEDKQYFPHIAGQPWLDVCLDAVENYRDESFILQFLSPALIRKWRLYEVQDNEDDPFYRVTAIQNEKHYNKIREALSKSYSMRINQPDIQIVDANLKGDRTLDLAYNKIDGRRLSYEDTVRTLAKIADLWGYPVRLDKALIVEKQKDTP
jgi:stage V sporulation protein R